MTMATFHTSSTTSPDIGSPRMGEWAPETDIPLSTVAGPDAAAAPLSSRHQRSLTEGQRRPSLLQLRSRSNTTNVSNGIAYPKHSMSPEVVQETFSPRGSFERPRNGLARSDRPESLRKGLMAKSSKLFRRPRSKDDLTSLRPLDFSDEIDHDICPATVEVKMPEKAPSRPVSRHFKKYSKTEETGLRRNISEPFNFQHLTHTDPRQYQKIQDTPHDDLVSEFSAMRAAQLPRGELQGIKAESISPRGDFYLDASPSETSSPPQTRDGFSTPPLRTPIQENAFSPVRSLHRAISIDSLSETSRPPSRGPTSPPSRSTSQFFSPEFFTIHEGSPLDAVPPTEFHTPSEDSAGFDYPIATWNSGVYDFAVPHAVTTPDDAAMPLRPPPFQMVRTELDKVLEEDESSEGRRSSAAATTTLPTTPSSGLRQAKSSPNLRRSPQKTSNLNPPSDLLEPPSFNVRPSSIFESTATDIPFRPKSCEPPSVIPSRTETSWEDDIDWCYNHEAEADCDFDWLNEPTIEVVANGENTYVETEQDIAAKQSPCSITPTQPQAPHRASSVSSSRPVSPTTVSERTSSMYSATPLILPTESSVPDLEPPSAVSAQSSFDSMSEAVTPVEVSGNDLNKRFLRAACKSTCQDCPPGSMAVMENDPEATTVYEDLFHVIYARAPEPEQTFSIGPVDGCSTSSTSPRSSHTLISNSSSQESFWSRHHGYSVSGSSVPDLIHSRQPVADQLAERLTGLDAASIAENGGQAIAPRRRSPSLAKDVAQKSIISKVMSRQSIVDDEDCRTPASSRSRAASDASLCNFDPTTPPRPSARPQSTRERSSSSAASVRSSSSATRRYSLFPTANVRDQIKAGMI